MNLQDTIQGEIDDAIDYAKDAINIIRDADYVKLRDGSELRIFTEENVETLIDTIEDLKRTLNAIDTSQIEEGDDE